MGLPLRPLLALSATSALMPDPLEVFREGLELFRHAGLRWFDSYRPAEEAALRVAPETERDEWAEAINATSTAWMRAFERRDTGVSL